MWHGRVPALKAAACREFVDARTLPDSQSVEGTLSVPMLEPTEGDITYFITLTVWNDLESITAFTGEDVEAARYHPEDQAFLLEFEPKVVRYERVGQS
jgi:heme-degrading monooxygenase HmoA